MTAISAIPAFSDNYIWLLSAGRDAVVVDPGDARPVQAALAARQLDLRAILLTHHHPDHVGGVAALLQAAPLPVYGPRAEAERIGTITEPLDDGDAVTVLGHRFTVIAVPGHTLGHIAYYSPEAIDDGAGVLFCGDTLFSVGCGRLFEGSPAQMLGSLQRLAALPGQTRVYCAHEYTSANLAFARVVEPGNVELAAYGERVRGLREQGQPSLPSTIAQERLVNPFLRSDSAAIRDALSEHALRNHGASAASDVAAFAALRAWKDNFRAA
jgi:hydroxyacylglutathione hydrolase